MGRPPIGERAMTDAERQRRHRLLHPKKRLIPKTNKPNHDIVQTPEVVARKIVQHFRPAGVCLDPARGSSRVFARMMQEQPQVTEVRWCEIVSGRDFFDEHRRCDWIVTNPPWSKMRKFIQHALTLADDIVYLGLLPAFQLIARHRDIKSAGFGLREALEIPNKMLSWPAGGHKTVAMWIARGFKGDLRMVDLSEEN